MYHDERVMKKFESLVLRDYQRAPVLAVFEPYFDRFDRARGIFWHALCVSNNIAYAGNYFAALMHRRYKRFPIDDFFAAFSAALDTPLDAQDRPILASFKSDIEKSNADFRARLKSSSGS